MNTPRFKQVWLALLLALPWPTQASDPVRMFGKNAPFVVRDLPADSRLRKQLEALPESTRKTALRHLHKINFPEQDAQHLNVSSQGRIYYSDPPPAKPIPAQPLVLRAAPQALAALPSIDVFKLHTRPNSKNRVFLDFDGMVLKGTEWNVDVRRTTLNARGFDLDGNESSFNNAERAAIHEIWHRIAEDYAPFDIDVTTEEPDHFTLTTGRVLFTRNRDANGALMPAYDAGGVAFSEVWNDPEYVSTYSPALVFYNNLGDSETNSMAEAGAHEFGHNLSLAHDGSRNADYFDGMGKGFVSWAPIMGVSYYENVTQWSKGEYSNADNKEDDIAIISRQLGVIDDDHGNTQNKASQLLFDNDHSLSVTTPQTDPKNTEPYNKGVIETRADVDMFFFDTVDGTLELVVEPAWTAFYRNENRGANLDIKATLYDGNGNAIKTDDPANDTNAHISAKLTQGRYYLAVEGVGNTVTPYSDYGSLGKYFISGALDTSVNTTPKLDTESPSPSPMTWLKPPTLTADNRVTMTATTATDNVGAVQYQFMCVSGGTGCSESAWQNSPNYTTTIGTGSYRYAVKARDTAGNETARSDEVTVTASLISATADTATVPEDNAVVIKVLDNDTSANGDKLAITQFSQGKNGSVIRKSGGLQYKSTGNFNGSDSFSYTVSNTSGNTATALVSINVIPVNDTPIARNDSVSVSVNTSTTLLPLSNDRDIDRDTLSIASLSLAKKGSAVIYGNAIRYQAGGSVGTDKLTYTISDGHGGTAKAVITVSVKK